MRTPPRGLEALVAVADAFLFDLDGTLADSRDAIWDAFAHAAAARGHALPPRARVDALVGHPLEDVFAGALGCDPHEAAALSLAYQARFAVAAPTLLRLMPGALEALDALRETPLGVVTTKRRAAAEATLAALGIRARFLVLVAREDARAMKPDPAPVLAACAALGVVPSRAVMVGDTALDVRAGKAAGARAIGVLGGHGSRAELEEAGADVVLAGLGELARAR